MLKPGKYHTEANVEAIIEELTTVRHLRKKKMDFFASMVENTVISLLARQDPEMDTMKIIQKAQGYIVAWGRINDVWKEPIWDWKTGQLLSANSPGNWSLHENFDIPPDSSPT